MAKAVYRSVSENAELRSAPASDPKKAMENFKSALGKIVKAPKTEFKAKHKHTTGRPNKKPKR